LGGLTEVEGCDLGGLVEEDVWLLCLIKKSPDMGLFCMLGLVLRWGMCEMVSIGSWISVFEIFTNCCWHIYSYILDHCDDLYA